MKFNNKINTGCAHEVLLLDVNRYLIIDKIKICWCGGGILSIIV